MKKVKKAITIGLFFGVLTHSNALEKTTRTEMTFKSIQGDYIFLKDGKVITRRGPKPIDWKKPKIPSKTTKLTKPKKSSKYSKTSKRKLLATAKTYMGTRYRYGGTSRKGLDCSAFVQKVYKSHGKNLPRTSRSQATVGKRISKRNLIPGDLVFFKKYKTISHVGIFLGNNKFIHASSGAKKVTISSLSKPYYKSHYAGARRI